MVVLLNVVIASFSSGAHLEKSNEKDNWVLMKARSAQKYLLILERNPLCMLPTPLNLICILFMPLHYGLIFLTKRDNDGGRKVWRVISVCGTVSDRVMSAIYN
eukprot:gene510-980_t